MRNRTKLVLAALTAALTLGALVGMASANRIAQSSQSFRTTWNSLEFLGFLTIRCHVTIEGSFHSRTISKVAEALVGYVSRAIVDEGHCTGGSARVLGANLPWHIRYESFTGTLPGITGINLRQVNAAFQVSGTLLGSQVNCLFTSSAASPMRGTVNVGTGGVAESLTPEEAAPIPKTSGGELCGTSGRLRGTSTSMTVQGAATKITVTLVA